MLIMIIENPSIKYCMLNKFCVDTGAARHISELTEYRFTGGIEVDSQGKLYRKISPTEPQYVGDPTPEIDRAWDDLLIRKLINYCS